MLPTIAARAVPAWCSGGLSTVLAAIAMDAGAIERRNARGQAQRRGSRGRPETGAGGDASSLAWSERPPERLSMPRRGFKHAGRQESSARWLRDTPRPQGAWLVPTAEAVAAHRVDRRAGGDEAHRRGWRGRVGQDGSEAQFVTHAGDEAQMTQDVAAVPGVSIHEALRCWGGESTGRRRN